MKVRIDSEGAGLLDAIEFAEAHVIVSRKDLNRIKRLAQRLGFYPQLKALGVNMMEFGVPGTLRPRPERRRR